MELLPNDVSRHLPPIAAPGQRDYEAIARLHFLLPWSKWAWFASEYCPELELFWGAIVGPQRRIFGYFALDELNSIRGPGGHRVERDIFWTARALKDCLTASTEDVEGNTRITEVVPP